MLRWLFFCENKQFQQMVAVRPTFYKGFSKLAEYREWISLIGTCSISAICEFEDSSR
jgi:hypothetical protein